MKTSKFKVIIAFCIAFTPFNFLRIFLYRSVLGYKITKGSKIGPFNFIVVKNCDIRNGRIGKFNIIETNNLFVDEKSLIGTFNRFKDIIGVSIGKSTVIRSNNTFFGTVKDTPYKQFETFSIKDNCTITNAHVFDCSDSIIIGSTVIIGGKASQFWTHGFTNDRVRIQGPIILEDNIYVGTRCLFMPAIRVCTDNVIAGGTTISKSIKESGIYASSKLMKITEVKKLFNSADVIVHNNSRYLRKEV